MLKKSINLHLEIFDENRLAVFKKLKKYKRFGFLAGGTALALQIGHRISYDFDIFCKKQISDQSVRSLARLFGFIFHYEE